MKKIKQFIIALALMMGAGMVMAPAPAAHAVNVFDQCKTNSSSAVCKAKNDNATNIAKTVVNLLLTVLGIISIIMIVIGGIRYTTSGGDAAGIKNARDTIIYAVVGLIVAILSFSIVNFVISWF
jgi:hypothetical protein